jgi:hypothetical protein
LDNQELRAIVVWMELQEVLAVLALMVTKVLLV